MVDVTRSLKPFFSRANKPLIVASVGGFTQDAFVSATERDKLYESVAKSLSEIDADGVEIIPILKKKGRAPQILFIANFRPSIGKFCL